MKDVSELPTVKLTMRVTPGTALVLRKVARDLQAPMGHVIEVAMELCAKSAYAALRKEPSID